VKLPVYSSLAAFLAHCRALSTGRDAPGRTLSAQESAYLNEMERLLASLGPDERAALQTDSCPAAGGSAERRRARAELKLRRVLAANSIIA
jgi:hypothetical protein